MHSLHRAKLILRDYIKKVLFVFSPKLHGVARDILYRRSLQKQFVEEVKKLHSGSLAIDLGANIGLVTEFMAKTSASIISFEPNEKALEKLRIVSNRYSNVKIEDAAAGTSDGTAKLFLHKKSTHSDNGFTQASSLLKNKPNVSEYNYQNVKTVDFSKYICGLNRKIDILKIDIEGYEIELINDMIKKNAFDNVNACFIETHERKMAELIEPTNELKKLLLTKKLKCKFYFDWH